MSDEAKTAFGSNSFECLEIEERTNAEQWKLFPLKTTIFSITGNGLPVLLLYYYIAAEVME